MPTINEFYDNLQSQSDSTITQTDLAKALGTTRSNISLRLKNKSDLKFDEVSKLEKHFEKVLTKSACQTARFIDEIEQSRNNVELATIEYYPDVYLSAGFGVEVLDESFEHVIIDERFLTSERGMRVNPKNCKMVRISGNSMFPEYHHGDRVIIDESDKNLTDGQIYAFRYDGQCYVKEINRAGNRIKCISVNKEYEPFFIEREVDFKVFGRIIPRVRL